jgi:peptidyl-dipeptidase Dcp
VEEFLRLHEGLQVTKEQARIFQRIRGQFDEPGKVSESQKKIDDINARLNILSSEFSSALTKERAAFRFKLQDAKDLEGLSPALIKTARERAEAEGSPQEWSFNLGEIDTILLNSAVPLVRKKAWVQRARIGQKKSLADNRSRVIEIAKLREERAKVAGHANAATARLRGRMAKTPETATNFLLDLAEKYRPGALKDKEELDAFAGHEVKPWEAPYYISRLKAERYGFKEKEVREYFPIAQVFDGFFYAAKKLYGVTFTPRLDIPKWDPSVLVYEVKDRDGKHLAIIYFDVFERPGEKRAGAWATSLERSGLVDGEAQRPLVVNVLNIKKPTPGEPALMSADSVLTLFHEGGHGLHQILSKTRYRTFSGTQVAWDFVELPSQFMENFAFQNDVLNVYARHYKTGEKLAPETIEKLKKSQTFRAATSGLAQVRSALLDLAWHTRDLSEVVDPRDIAKFEKSVMSPHQISKTYGTLQSTTFTHVFSGGYDAGYYSYKWADVLASDAFEAFQQHGLFDATTAEKMQKSILERGGVYPADQMYRDFRGRDPDPAALLRKEGLLPPLPAPDAQPVGAVEKPAA